MDILDTIVELSHELGTAEYVKGGGGNSSAKNAETLWVKPSGTILKNMSRDSFVAMDRAKIDELYGAETPAEDAAREELVKNLMAAAVTNEAGRPSVEAPLHNVFAATYVVHTHPYLVNGMTCAVEGERVCRELFPEALWVEYVNPGYTLCMELRKRIQQYTKEHGKEPEILMLKNHGVFIAADTSERIRDLYKQVLGALGSLYEEAGVSSELHVDSVELPGALAQELKQILGSEAVEIAGSTVFECVAGPLTPDHLVYAKAFPFKGKLSAEGVEQFKAKHGYLPKVLQLPECVVGVGATKSHAALALEFAQDAAQVAKLTAAFGGVEFMSDRALEFIENWEVESYRAKQV